jgi:hypothetical protein
LIVHAQRNAIRIAEVKLGQVAVQVGFADVLIDANQAALQDAEIALDGVRVRFARTYSSTP